MMGWSDPDFQRYFRSLFEEFYKKKRREADASLVRFRTQAGRAGMTSGVHVALAISEYVGLAVRQPTLYCLDAFEEACSALGVEPTESDYDALLNDARAFASRGADAARQQLGREMRDHSGVVESAFAHDQVFNNILADLAPKVERKKIEVGRKPQRGRPRGATSVFISHIAEDATVALALKSLLTVALGSETGVFVSSDYDSIRSGSDWHGAIVEALKSASAVVVLISAHSYSRPWINYEAGVGDGAVVPVVPVVIRGFPKSDVKPPLGRHHARSFDGPDEVRALLRDLAEFTGKQLTGGTESRIAELLEEAGKVPLESDRSAETLYESLSRRMTEDPRIAVRPVVPRRHSRDTFILERVSHDLVEIKKEDSGHLIAIPVRKIARAYPMSSTKPWLMELDGRLQWIDPTESWIFLPVLPSETDPLGLFKDVTMQQPRVVALIDRLRTLGYRLAWQREADARAEDGVSCSVVYDEDGEYLRQPDRQFNQILVKMRSG